MAEFQPYGRTTGAARARPKGRESPRDAAYMAHVAPGKTGTLVWQFTRPGELYYGCLVPAHFEAGIVGRIIVTKGSGK